MTFPPSRKAKPCSVLHCYFLMDFEKHRNHVGEFLDSPQCLVKLPLCSSDVIRQRFPLLLLLETDQLSSPGLALFPGSDPAQSIRGEKVTVPSYQVKPRGAQSAGRSLRAATALAPRLLLVPKVRSEVVLSVITEVSVAQTRLDQSSPPQCRG